MRNTGFSFVVLILLGLAGCRQAVETESVETAAVEATSSYCDGELVAGTIGASEASPTLEPDFGLGPWVATWTGDLNADGLEDAVLRFPEACGNYGECPFAVLVACEEEEFAIVWGPDYATHLAVLAAGSDADWKALELELRDGDELVRTQLAFEDGSY